MKRADVASMLTAAGLDPDAVQCLVDTALAEDLRYGPDVTSTSTVDASATLATLLTARQRGVIAGVPIALAVICTVDESLDVDLVRPDGSEVEPGDVILRIEGPALCILLAERTMLNLISHLSGVATTTRAWVDEVAGTGVTIRDTRKTLPGLRELQKYAVRCGGGSNHRLGLGDAILIKDNHVAAGGGITAAVTAARRHQPDLELQVECDTLEHVREALAAGVRSLLLDNMALPELRASVRMARGQNHGVRLEASGGINLDRARTVANTGVDTIAIGALTHSSPALDLGLDTGTLANLS